MTAPPVIERTLQHCARPADLDRIHQLLQQLWSAAGAVDGRDRIGFELAVIEVAGNIAEHSRRSAGFDCDLVVRIQPDQLEAEFTDTGDPLTLDLESAVLPDEMADHGRGLAIAKLAVDELSYTRDGQFNTWRIRRRRREQAAGVANGRRPRAAAGWQPPAAPGIVLVVEDDADLGGFLRTALERRMDRPIRLAENALVALQILSLEAVDVLVTDIQMPGMSGLELVSRIRQSYPALPIIMMTAHASVDYAIDALRHQVDEFLIKPISAGTLVPKVQELAERGVAARRTARALADIDPAMTSAADLMRAEQRMLQDLSETMGQRESLSQQLEHAAQVQRDLLPRHAPRAAGWEMAGTCVPSFAIGGDFYDWYTDDTAVEFTVADVMGKGIPAALVTATVRAVIRGVDRTTGPAESLRAASVLLAQDLSETGTFVTMFLGRLDTSTGALRYADAGHGLGLHVRVGGGYSRLVSKDLPLGIDAGTADSAPTWVEQTLTLDPGDTVISFSDGLFDLLGGDEQAIVEVAAIVATSVDCAGIVARVSELAGQSTLIDDVTVVAVRRNPVEI